MFTPDFIKGFAAGVICILAMLVFLALGFGLFKPWIRIKMMGGKGSLLYVMAMRLRGSPAMLIADAYTTLLHSGEQVNLYLVESQYVANKSKILSVSDLVEHIREYKRRETAIDEQQSGD